MFKNFLEKAKQIASNLLSNPIIQKQIPAVQIIDNLIKNNNISIESGLMEKVENLVLVARKNPRIRGIVNHLVSSSIKQFVKDPSILDPENQHKRQQTAFNYGYGFEGFTDIQDRTETQGDKKNLDNSKPQEQTKLSVSDGKDMSSNQTGVLEQLGLKKIGVDLGIHVQIDNEVINKLKQKLIDLVKNGSPKVSEKAKNIMEAIQQSAINAKIAIQNLQKGDSQGFNQDHDEKQNLGMVDSKVQEFEKGEPQIKTFSDLVVSKTYIQFIQQKIQEKQLTQDQNQLAQETLFNSLDLIQNISEYNKPKNSDQQKQIVDGIVYDMQNDTISGIIVELIDLNSTQYSISEVLDIAQQIITDISKLDGQIKEDENIKESIQQQQKPIKKQKKESNTFQISQSSAYRIRPLN